MSNARNISKADSRFVNATGDTMSGDFAVLGSNGTGVRILPSTSPDHSLQRFVNNSTDDTKYIIAYGNNHVSEANNFAIKNTNGSIFLETNNYDRMRIDGSGRVTTPYQPYFLANNYGQAKASGWQQVAFTTYVQHNVGGHYSSSNSRFTAPVAGIYVFSTGGYIQANNSTERYALAFHVNGNGGAYIGGGTQAATDAPLGTVTQAISLNANDYVTVMMYTPNAETLGASYHRMWFNGYLLG